MNYQYKFKNISLSTHGVQFFCRDKDYIEHEFKFCENNPNIGLQYPKYKRVWIDDIDIIQTLLPSLSSQTIQQNTYILLGHQEYLQTKIDILEKKYDVSYLNVD